jgi:hypothetical protein
MVDELKAAGWIEKVAPLWFSPFGRIYLGAAQAWHAMRFGAYAPDAKPLLALERRWQKEASSLRREGPKGAPHRDILDSRAQALEDCAQALSEERAQLNERLRAASIVTANIADAIAEHCAREGDAELKGLPLDEAVKKIVETLASLREADLERHLFDG